MAENKDRERQEGEEAVDSREQDSQGSSSESQSGSDQRNNEGVRNVVESESDSIMSW